MFLLQSIMGNKLLTSYKVEKEASVRSTDTRWSLFPAVHSDRPAEPLTVFLIEKKLLEKGGKEWKEAVPE